MLEVIITPGRGIVKTPMPFVGRATVEERRKLPLTVLDAVCVDTQGDKRVPEVEPKAAFGAVWPILRSGTRLRGLEACVRV